ncbi:MAG: TRAP transporter small permease [Proteobacteria bacterium]|nr:TRAP transporter small permease [Pseudomonadota bacterium]
MPKNKLFGFDVITSTMNSIGTAWVFILLVIINLDIFSRFLFNSPIRGVPEIVSLSIVALVFMQIAHTLKVGRLTRSETLLNLLKQKFPRIASILQGIFHLVGAGLFAIILQGSYPMFVKAWTIDEYVGAEGDFMAPVWPVKLIILIGSAAAIIQFLLLALRDFKQLGTPAAAGITNEGGNS